MPGEMVPFNAKISNNSTTEIKNTTVKLVQMVSKLFMLDLAALIARLIFYRQVGLHGQAQGVGMAMVKKNMITTTIFESVRDEGISPGGHQEWTNYMIQASLLPPLLHNRNANFKN